MAGGGMGGVSSTGYGQPTQTGMQSPFSEKVMDGGDTFIPTGNRQPMTLGQTLGQMFGSGGQQQQLAPGATEPASREAYMNTLSTPARAAQNLNAMSGLLGGYAQNTSMGQVNNMYQSLLGRNPDQEGANFWSQAIDSGYSPDAVRNQIMQSQEFQNRMSTVPDTITGYYKNLLGRDPDAEGLNFWTQAAQSGHSLDDIRNTMMTSPEYQNRRAQTPAEPVPANTGDQIADMYQNLLGRKADEGGYGFWNQALQSGTSADDIRNQIMQSQEYQTRQQQLAMAPQQPAMRAAPVAPTVTQSGGTGSGGAVNYQYRRGGIASLLRRR